jgi:DNA-directed RNA polymerase subunit RPC12/RpoP
MASCRDCIHHEICQNLAGGPFNVIDADTSCTDFKDRSHFVELPHAEWVEDEDMYGDPIYRCSNCSEHFVLEEGTPTDNCYSYCPNCGAKMDVQALKELES